MNRVFTRPGLWLAAMATGLSGLAAEPYSIAGRVVDETGQGLEGVTVVFSRVTDLARDNAGRIRAVSPMLSDAVMSLAGGAFLIVNLPRGQYYLCALPHNADYVASCEWNRPAVRVQVGPSTGEAGHRDDVVLVVERGRRVQIEIADLRKEASAEPELLISLGTSEGYFHRAELVSVRGILRLYSVAVPKDKDTFLFFDGPVSISDVAGTPIPLRSRALQVPKNSGNVVHLRYLLQ